ncbi:MAG: bifunctional 3,4-dihydroxy-2-butanone-4-phosphate synthase/GTP cyclohydrolase II [Deltaproteobacteria bacterium]|nr:bifunctional 3,4-dihydroxy-2-butanone-4-phosphate synthase/GTP cyclohydrolase II [Deltaproteobacteria bacterium]MCL5792152.1 bifunctional 3,4-dihydroxy-2-butanone-4-phosphate synthase/GTP cyclohydrolase II [Deltaproteobacteria bacterium]
MPITSIEKAIDDIKNGKMVILVDDENRENEGDLCIAAEKATPEIISFMAIYGRGLICLSLTEDRLNELNLPLMVNDNTSKYGTAFTVSIDAKEDVTTGISAYDRAKTIQVVIDDKTKPYDLVRPGHVFPLMYKKGGVLVRAGQTEGSVDLARLAGLKPAAVICEIMKDDGTMARMPDLEKFSNDHGIGIVTIEKLIHYRMTQERLVKRVSEANIPTEYGGEFKAIVYENDLDYNQHIALIKGNIDPQEPVLVRVHSECLTGDVFGSKRCDCGSQLHEAMKMIEKEGRGVILYLRQEGRGIGLANKIMTYSLQDQGFDTVEANHALGFPADLRDYGIGAQILADIGVKKMRLMTNNPKKLHAIAGYGLEVVERVPIEITPNNINARYLKTKQDKMGHILHLK